MSRSFYGTQLRYNLGTSDGPVRWLGNVLAFTRRSGAMNGIIYLIGLVVVVMAVLSFFGMH